MSDSSESVNAEQTPGGDSPAPAPPEPPTVAEPAGPPPMGQTPPPPPVAHTAPPVAPTPSPPAPSTAPVAPPIPVPQDSGASADLAHERPELLVGGAFAGGIMLALILKRLGR